MPQESPEPQSPQEPKEEKLEFLKREEVRTMAKDIAKLREGEAKGERERIATLQKEPKKPQVVLSQQPSQEEKPLQKKQPLIPRRPLKRSEKLFIRLVIGGIVVFLIFNAVAFGFWYFLKRDVKPQPTPQDIQQEVQAPPAPLAPQPIPTQPAPVEPTSPAPVIFFKAPEQELSVETPEKLLVKLKDFLAGGPALGFTNLVVKTKGAILSPQEFLKGTKITIPQELRERLERNRMLFAYVTENKKRLGFVMELKKTEGVSGLLRSWEQSMEQDLASFFDIIGRKGSAYTPFFRFTTYQGVQVRFQTFSVIDFGIVYGIVQGKLLLTSSLESFQRAVDQLKTI